MIDQCRAYITECRADTGKFDGAKVAEQFDQLRKAVVQHCDSEEKFLTAASLQSAYPNVKYVQAVEDDIGKRAQADMTPAVLHLGHLLSNLSADEQSILMSDVPWVIRQTLFRFYAGYYARSLWVFSSTSD